MSQTKKSRLCEATQSCFRTPYSPPFDASMKFAEFSRWTKQSFAEECDINTIMRKYNNSGEMPAINIQAPQYLDATGFDFQAAMQFTAGAQSLFNELPSAVRNRFNNDPAQFLDFTSKEENKPEMAQMGLLRDEVAQALLYPSPIEEKPNIVPPAPSDQS